VYLQINVGEQGTFCTAKYVALFGQLQVGHRFKIIVVKQSRGCGRISIINHYKHVYLLQVDESFFRS